MTCLTILAKRWRDYNGNSCVTSKLYIDNQLVLDLDETFYAPDDHFIQHTIEKAAAKGILPPLRRRANGVSQTTVDYMQNNQYQLLVNESIVNRKKDL